MAQPQARVITAREVDAIPQAPENRARRLERVRGEVVEKRPTEAHGKPAALSAPFLLVVILPRGIQAHVGVEV